MTELPAGRKTEEDNIYKKNKIKLPLAYRFYDKGAETVEMESFTFRLSSWAVMKGTESSTASVPPSFGGDRQGEDCCAKQENFNTILPTLQSGEKV